MKNFSKDIFKRLFFILVFIPACFTTNSNNLSGYLSAGGSVVIIFKYLLIFSFVFIATLLNRDGIDFLSKFVPISTVSITALLIFDYYVTKLSGSQFLFRVWWIGTIFVANSAVFLAVTINNKDERYRKFHSRFWLGFTPIYVFLLFICFVRAPFSSMSTNFVLGNGTFLMFKAFFKNVHTSFEAPLIAFGNYLIFVPLASILSVLFSKIKSGAILITGIIIPFIIEGYQFIFECGNVDIDDIVLNISGFILGFIIYLIVKKNHLAEES